MKYDKQQYERGDKLIDCVCDRCGITYQKKRVELSRNIRENRKQLLCTSKCTGNNTQIVTNCKYCDKEIIKTSKQLERAKSGYLFCNTSCSTSYYNQFNKRKPKLHMCECGREKVYRRKLCSVCREKQTKALYDRPISAVVYGKGANRFNHIRGMARTVYKQNGNKICLLCGYDKHIDIAHIKSISDFELTAKISEVNSMSNLLGLCKNCHWEFDNGLISITKKE